MYDLLGKFVLIFYIISIYANDELCPGKCSCKRFTTDKEGVLLKMACGEKNKIIHLGELELLSFSHELVQLYVFPYIHYNIICIIFLGIYQIIILPLSHQKLN